MEGGIPPLVELLEFTDTKVQRVFAGAHGPWHLKTMKIWCSGSSTRKTCKKTIRKQPTENNQLRARRIIDKLQELQTSQRM